MPARLDAGEWPVCPFLDFMSATRTGSGRNGARNSKPSYKRLVGAFSPLSRHNQRGPHTSMFSSSSDEIEQRRDSSRPRHDGALGSMERGTKLLVAWIREPSPLTEAHHDTETSLAVDRARIPRDPGSLLRDGRRGR